MNTTIFKNMQLNSVDATYYYKHTTPNDKIFIHQQKYNGDLFTFEVLVILRVLDKNSGEIYIGERFIEHAYSLNLINNQGEHHHFYNWLINNENNSKFDDRFEIFDKPYINIFNSKNQSRLTALYFSSESENEKLIQSLF